MSNNESDVERHLHRKITELGGTTRKWTSPNYVGVPDRIVIDTITVGEMIERLRKLDPTAPFADISFTEVKTMVGKLSPMQEREIKRLREHGARVDVVYGKKGVDLYIDKLKGDTDVEA